MTPRQIAVFIVGIGVAVFFMLFTAGAFYEPRPTGPIVTPSPTPYPSMWVPSTVPADIESAMARVRN